MECIACGPQLQEPSKTGRFTLARGMHGSLGVRYLFGWACVYAFAAFAAAGCADGSGGTGGAGGGGAGGTAGSGGSGGMGGGGAGGAGGAADSAWALSIGASLNDRGSGLAALPDGTFVVTGAFQETVAFGAGEANETALTSAGVEDVFVARYDGDGALSWAKRAGGVAPEGGTAVATFADGSSVVCGAFQQTATFGLGEPNETMLTSVGGDDVFVARYNADGTLAWAKRAGGAEFDTCRGNATLSDGFSVIAGGFAGSITFGAGETNETTLTASGSVEGALDIFVARFGSDGSLIWATQAGGDASDIANDMATSALDSFIVGGRFEGTATFGEGESGETQLTSRGATDIFVARYNSNGTLAWVKSAGGLQGDQSWGVATFGDGSSVATGSYLGAVTFGADEANETQLSNPGEGFNVFVARYHPDGTLAWAKRAGSEMSAVGRSIGSMADGASVVTGRFEGTATFGPGEPGETKLTSGGGNDMFLAGYEATGNLRWATRAGGAGAAAGNSVVSLSDGSIAVTGLFTGTTTFHGGTADETDLTSNGERECFVARYSGNGI
jgi:hypothetical protein